MSINYIEIVLDAIPEECDSGIEMNDYDNVVLPLTKLQNKVAQVSPIESGKRRLVSIKI